MPEPLCVRTADEAEIQELVWDELNAICDRDLDRLMRRYAPDVVFYNYGRPVCVLDGGDAVRRMWQTCLRQLPDSLRARVEDISIRGVAEDGVMSSASLQFAGLEFDHPRGPHTVLFRRMSGGWQVVSETIFVPFKPGTDLDAFLCPPAGPNPVL